MNIFADLKDFTREQWAAFIASLLGWSLDAFDFFLVVFVLRSIATDFHAQVVNVAYALTLTLMFRPLGALIFGWLADRYGRRPILMVDILLFSLFELGSAFAPSLTTFLILRALFGIAMGGEWGIGSSLVMETIPAKSRGIVSGILQQGYPLGYLLATLVYWLLFDRVGWRGMLIVGVLPALLVLYIRLSVKESPVFMQKQHRTDRPGLLASLQVHWKRFLYAILLMTAFNFLSHGTQDLYPTFLQTQHKFSTQQVSLITVIANCGAIIGGVTFGAFSQRLGRRRAIIAASLLVLPIVPLWAFAQTPLLLALGAFLIQIAVQGAWGSVPAHLNELSPGEIRGTFPGFTYQLGNLFASSNAVLQVKLAAAHDNNYAFALATVAGVAVFVLVTITALGPEAREVILDGTKTSLQSV